LSKAFGFPFNIFLIFFSRLRLGALKKNTIHSEIIKALLRTKKVFDRA